MVVDWMVIVTVVGMKGMVEERTVAVVTVAVALAVPVAAAVAALETEEGAALVMLIAVAAAETPWSHQIAAGPALSL